MVIIINNKLNFRKRISINENLLKNSIISDSVVKNVSVIILVFKVILLFISIYIYTRHHDDTNSLAKYC